jgi:ElaB/YqjD/DUF883 family membrane-anchored ribosome-binding protein
MSAEDYPALGFNPAPGTVATIDSVASDLKRVSEKMGNAHQALTGISRQDGLWAGKAAEAFKGTVDELPKYLDQAHRSLGGAAKTLFQWAQDLSALQQKARDCEAQAAAAQQRVRHAESNPDFNLAGQHFPDQASLQQAQARLDAAQAALSKANAELEAIREQAGRLLNQHADLAQQVEKALRRAADEAPEKPGLLERIGDAFEELGQAISDVADKAWQWVKDHADVIKQVGDVLSKVGNVLGVVAIATSWIPGVNAVTAGAAATVSAAALGTKALAKAGGADVSWGSMATDAIGIIPGGRFAAGAKNAVKQAARAGKPLAPKAITVESKVLQNTTGVTGKVNITPTTMAELKANPKEAIENAAAYTHAKSVDLLNKIPRVNIDPFSTSGIISGAAVESAKKMGVQQAGQYAGDQAESYYKQKIG